ncbi:hypothetical protein Tco_1202563 [Tanacetum coccineum]
MGGVGARWRTSPIAGEDQIIKALLGASRGLLGDLSRGLVALLLRLRSPLGKVFLAIVHSRCWEVSHSVGSHGCRQSVDTK